MREISFILSYTYPNMFCNMGQEGPLKPEKTEVLASKLKERVSVLIMLAVTDDVSKYFDSNSFF